MGEHIGDFVLVVAAVFRETGLVDTVVDVVVGPLVDLVDLGFQLLWNQVWDLSVAVSELVEGVTVQDSDDLTALVVDNGLGLSVP